MMPLTKKQAELLTYLRSCERAPSFVEMRDALGQKSKSGIHRLIVALEERGYIRRLPNRTRAIEVVEDARLPGPEGRSAPYYLYRPHPDIVMIPLHGRIS